MFPLLIGLGIYSGIGLAVRHFRFPKEPVYVAGAWPIVLVLGTK